jgi:uncharacterized membrane protein
MAKQAESGLERVVAFSDGIFAVAITLLVLSIAVPDLGGQETDANLQARLADTIPSIVGFVVSFVIVGVFWLSHHRLFQVVREYDRPTLYANLLFLMTICFLPFPTGVVAHYGQLATAVMFYAASMAFAGFTLALLWWVAAIRPAHRKALRRVGRLFALRALALAAVFLISVPITLIDVNAGRFAWLAIPLLLVIIGRIYSDEVREDLRPSI